MSKIDVEIILKVFFGLHTSQSSLVNPSIDKNKFR